MIFNMVHADKDIVIIPRDQIDAWLMVMNAAERFVVMSGDIISAARTGEPYEVLVRQLTALHANLQALAELAGEAKQCQIKRSRCCGNRPCFV